MKIFSVVFLFLILAGLLGFKYFIAPQTVTDNSSQPIRIGENAIYVSEQKPGPIVMVSLVSLARKGYVVIHENIQDRPGNIIGSTKILNEGESRNVAAGLLRPSVQGEEFFAMPHEDTGDGIFSPSLDPPLQDDLGNVIIIKFRIDRNAPEIPDVSI